MAGRSSTCKGCGVAITADESFVYSGKKYCKKCHDEKVEGRKEYTDLIITICEYFEIDKPTGLIFKHIKDYQEQFDYGYAGMQYTLWFCKFIKSYKFDPKYGIACVKYEFENAKEYYMQQIKIQESVTTANETEEYVKEITVNVKKQERKSMLINIDELISKDGDM